MPRTEVYVYKVVEVKRNDRDRPDEHYGNFAARVEEALNDLVAHNWEVVEICMGRYDCILVAAQHRPTEAP